MFMVSSLDIYTTCPKCKAETKLRSFAALHEIEDVFDAVLEWMQPGAAELAERRQEAIAADALCP